MQADHRVLLAGRDIDALGIMDRSASAASKINANRDQNALRTLFAEQGPGIMSGDRNALAAYARLNPEAALGVQNQRQVMDARELSMRVQQQAMEIAQSEYGMRVAEFAQKADAAERAEASQVYAMTMQEAARAYLAGDLDGVNEIFQRAGVGPVDSLDAALPRLAEVEAARGVIEWVNKQSAGPDYRQVTGEEAAALGLDPAGSYNVGPDGKVTSIGGGNTNINVNTGAEGPQIGTIPQGYEVFRNEEGAYRMRPIPGGPEDTSTQDAARAGAAETSGDVILNAALRAREANRQRLLTGAAGAIASINPANMNAELQRQVDVLRANATIESLNAMRQQSPTGGALGNVTEGEGRMLAARAGALDPASPNFERDLADYTRTLLRVIHGPEAGEAIFARQWNTGGPENPSRSGPTQTFIDSLGGAGDAQAVWDNMTEQEKALFADD